MANNSNNQSGSHGNQGAGQGSQGSSSGDINTEKEIVSGTRGSAPGTGTQGGDYEENLDAKHHKHETENTPHQSHSK
jgi:hypothetical protein